jgi:hypothetical protein
MMGKEGTPPAGGMEEGLTAMVAALNALSRKSALKVIATCNHLEGVYAWAVDEAISGKEVAFYNDLVDARNEIAELRKAKAEADADAERLQALIAEGDRDAALDLLRDMFQAAPLLSDAAARMLAGIRQEAML